MALSIKSEEADRLARQLVAETGETLTEAVVISLRERLDRARGRPSAAARRLEALAEEVAAMPVLDPRQPDELVGYDSAGIPA